MSAVEHDPRKVSLKLPRAEARWMMGLARLAPGAMAVAVAAPLLAGVFLVVQAGLLARVLGDAITGGVGRAELLPSLLAIGGLLLARALLAAAGEGAAAAAAERIKRVLREALFAHLLERRPDWMRTRASGALASALVDQVEALDGFFARYLPSMVAATVLPLAFATVLLPIDLVVGLLLLLTAPLIPVFMALVGWGAEAASRRHLAAFARLSGLFADRLRGLLTLRLFGRGTAEVEAVRRSSGDLAGRTLAVLRIAFLSSAVLEFFAALGIAGVALSIGLGYLGLVELRAAPLTLEAGLFCLLMAPEVYLPLRQFAAHYHDRAAARAAVAELAAALETLPDIAPAEEPAAPAPAVPARPASLTVSALTVAVPGGPTPIRGADLVVAAGEHVALLGESGVGKSTLLEALACLREAQGTILLDGETLARLPERELRARVALLGQRPHLFAGTIAENIRLGRPDASWTEVEAAAAAAAVDAFTDRLPARLDTVLGERGLGLSGGEVQRVALARIYLRRPSLVLLDEPTAHLDAATEALVLDGLLTFAEGRTLLVATHSAAVAARMDRVLRVAGGRLLPVRRRVAGLVSAAQPESVA